MENEVGNISLSELSEIEGLNARTQNICEYCNLKDIQSILDYYWENFDFLKLRNCGSKSNLKLIDICHKYEKIIYQPKNVIIPEKQVIPENKDNPIIEKIDSLTIRQKKIVNNLIETHLNELSVRSSNALKAYFGSNIDIIGIKMILSNQESEIRNMRNVGERSIIEINGYVAIVIELIELISLFENETEINVELFHAYLMRKFSISKTILNEIDNNYDFSNGIPIFRTIKVLVDKEIIYTQRNKEIFYLGLVYFNDSTVCSLDKLAEISELTRERTRQVREDIYENLNETFSFLKGLEFEAMNLYGIDVSSNLIIVSEEQVFEINQKEDNSFNLLFINKILSILLENSHSLIGNEEIIVLEKIKVKRSSHNWNSTYLIKSELTNIFNFEEFINDIECRLNERIEEDYGFHFEAYTTKFQKKDCLPASQIIIPILEQLLFNEFEISIDINDNIIFKRNTIKQVYEYAHEALEALGQPSKVIEIYRKVIELYPDFSTDENSIRASMQRKTHFIPFSRTSVYGLKEWEEEQDIRGGTIKDITEEFLSTQTQPKHIDEITEYVSKYRDTNSKNIYSNLRMEENNRFVFFKGLHIGLKSIKYNVENFVTLKKNQINLNSWEENFILLKDFVEKKQRRPYSSGIAVEKRLYRFMIIQLNRLKHNKLECNKKIQFVEMITSYPPERKSRRSNDISFDNISAESFKNQDYIHTNKQSTNSSSWWYSFNELKDFLCNNKEYPKASSNRALYSFCYNCNRKLQDGSLNKSQIEALAKLDFCFLTENKNTWEENISNLACFYSLNKHWPKYLYSDKKQVKLYRFCMLIFKLYKNSELNIKQLQQLDNIGFPYALGVFTNAWLDNYEKLKRFRNSNPNRWPHARSSALEKLLYQFCYRNKNKYLIGTLEDFKIQLLNEINFDFYG